MKEVYIKKNELSEWLAKYFKQDLISIDDLLGVMEDLDSDVKRLEEKIQDLEQDIEENYISMPIANQCGISDRDFI